MISPSLDQKASHHFSYRDLIECGTTAKRHLLFIEPKQVESWVSLSLLATNILDPIVEKFGPVTLTYGFCSPELARQITKNRFPHIAPNLDQHWYDSLTAKVTKTRLMIGLSLQSMVMFHQLAA